MDRALSLWSASDISNHPLYKTLSSKQRKYLTLLSEGKQEAAFKAYDCKNAASARAVLSKLERSAVVKYLSELILGEGEEGTKEEIKFHLMSLIRTTKDERIKRDCLQWYCRINGWGSRANVEEDPAKQFKLEGKEDLEFLKEFKD